ncbi:MAG: MBL fold metallo-hydrolase [Clostridiales bacterium]|nr:MBL fold metallo-hydrolase [Clostridiales bacterium]
MTIKLSDYPEIWQIPVELPQSPLKNLNSYVIRTPEQNLVIDTGFNRPECRNALWNGMEELNIEWKKTALFVTHGHTDHMGLAPAFAEQGCTIYMSQIDYDYFKASTKGYATVWRDDLYLKESFPKEELAKQNKGNQDRFYAPKDVFPVTTVKDRDQIMVGSVKAVCIHTPGHSMGHMMLYLPDSEVLFSGDHVLFDITPNIGIWSPDCNSLRDYLDSLQKTKELSVKLTLPAHRGTMKKNLYQRIDELITHHEERLKEIKMAIREHPGTDAYSIAGHITWSAKGLEWDEFPTHQKWFAMGETLAHLYYLVEKGEVIRQDLGDQVAYYTI